MAGPPFVGGPGRAREPTLGPSGPDLSQGSMRAKGLRPAQWVFGSELEDGQDRLPCRCKPCLAFISVMARSPHVCHACWWQEPGGQPTSSKELDGPDTLQGFSPERIVHRRG